MAQQNALYWRRNMLVHEIIEHNGAKYKYMGNGPTATGGNPGWSMSPDVFFRCIVCGYIMNGDPDVDDGCSCGKLHKDSGYGRLGSSLGDNAIEVFCRV